MGKSVVNMSHINLQFALTIIFQTGQIIFNGDLGGSVNSFIDLYFVVPELWGLYLIINSLL